MTPDRGSPPADDELIEAVARTRGAVLLVGAWASKTIVAVGSRSLDTSVIALTEADAARIRGLATAERLPLRVYLPSAVLDPMVVRDRRTGTVRWTADLLGPVPALSRVAVAGFMDGALAATLRTALPAEAIVVVAGDVQAVPEPAVPRCYPVLDSLETVAHAASRPTARAVFSSFGMDFEDVLASEDPGVSFNSLPGSTLAAIWHVLAPTPLLGPSPGWRFDDAWMDDDPLVRLRRRLWECISETSPGVELQLRWFAGTTLRTRIGTDLSFQLFVAGRYEPNELFAFAALPRGGIAIDAGANEGLYTLLGAVRAGSAGRIVVIEPSDRERAILEDNITTNGLGNVTVEPIALLDRPAETKLRIAEFHHAGQNTLGSFAYDGVRASTTVTVHADRLDSVIETLRLSRVDVLKLDVEGAEHCVLRGAEEVLRRLRPFIILELQNDSLRFMGSSRLEAIAELRSHDYEVRDFHPETGLVGLPSCDDDTLSLNVMAAPHGHFPPALARSAGVSSLGTSG